MSNEVAVRAGGAIVPAWTDEQLALIKRTVAKDTTNDELALFLHAAKRSGLDPLAKQIHCVKRKSKDGPAKMSIQTAIDGYRLIADRTGKYAGNDDPVFDDEKNPTKATVSVYKIVEGQRCAFTATARWSQYYPGDLQGFMWKKMPHLMLGKCAEALALRKAFPAEMSGIYTNEEMEQSEAAPTITAPVARTAGERPERGGKYMDPVAKPAEQPQPIDGEVVDEPGDAQEPAEEAPKPAPSEVISASQGKRLYAIWKTAGKADEDVKAYLKQKYGLNSTRDIKKGDQYEAICAWAEQK